MKNDLIIVFISFFIAATAFAADEPVNVPIDNQIDNIPIMANNLRSDVFSLKAEPGNSAEKKIFFYDFPAVLQEISFVPTHSSKSGGGDCRLNIKINDSLVKIMQWQALTSKVKKDKLNTGTIIAGIWEPPGGIVFNPKDILTVEIIAHTSAKEGSICGADFVVLGAGIYK